MDINKVIVNKVESRETLDLSELKVFQGKLKVISKEKIDDLKASLVKNGIDLCFHIWKDSKNNNQILDGTHRFYALNLLRDEGYFIPPLSVVYIIAKTRKEAAQIILIMNSRYAKMNLESISDFMIDNELTVSDLDFLDIPELNMKDFNLDIDDISDLEDLDSVDENFNFTIKCNSHDEFKQVQEYFETSASKVKFATIESRIK